MLWKILIGAAVVIVLFLVAAATRRPAYRVERKLAVAAPAELVFGVLNDLHQFARVFVLFGSPLEKLDPGAPKTFAGPVTGVGQSVAWSGKDAGKGKITIEESVASQTVGMKLEFVEPMASTAAVALTLASTPTGSVVTWSMEGNHNFIGKAVGMFVDMDKMLGADIEKGLAELKTVAEGKQAATVGPPTAQVATDPATAPLLPPQ